MKLEDIKIGMKVKIPKTKSVGCRLEDSYVLQKVIETDIEYLSVTSIESLNNSKVIGIIYWGGRDLFLPEDLEHYEESKSERYIKTMEFFNQLEEPMRSQAIENYEEDYSNRVPTTLADALGGGFDWQLSSQGLNYWENIHFNLQYYTIQEKDNTTQFHKVLSSLADLLQYKNEKYGNSALEPLEIFGNKSKAGTRLDDKLARIKNSTSLKKNDIADCIGYLSLICVENGWDNFDEFKD